MYHPTIRANAAVPMARSRSQPSTIVLVCPLATSVWLGLGGVESFDGSSGVVVVLDGSSVVVVDGLKAGTVIGFLRLVSHVEND